MRTGDRDPKQVNHAEWTVITCGVLEKELLSWPGRIAHGVEFVFLPSSLDLSFYYLKRALVRTLSGLREKQKHGRLLVLYGQCHPNIAEFVAEHHGRLLPLGNCYELLLGKQAYQRHLAAGSYFLLPQWAGYWQKVFTRKLGFTPELGGLFFPDMHTQAIYLDTSFEYPRRFDARAFEQFTRLPVKTEKIDLTHMYDRLDACFADLTVFQDENHFSLFARGHSRHSEKSGITEKLIS